VLEFVEPGEIESAENVEIKSEVRSRSSSGTAILEIVPEGKVVKKGDFLVRLDDASLQKDLLRQRISVHQSKATLVKATADVEAAKLALQEYLSGSFRENEEQLESAEFVAKENLRRAQEYLVYSKKLAAKGYVSEAQLEADQFAVEKARKELDLAQTKLEVLRTHSRKAKVNDLNASKPEGSFNRAPITTSSSGKAKTALRRCSVTIAFKTVSRLLVRLIEERPIITLGVPPILSSVKKEKPFNRPFSRVVVHNTHSSVCFEISPIPKGFGPSAQSSVISSSSASPSMLQSFVSTSIVIETQPPFPIISL